MSRGGLGRRESPARSGQDATQSPARDRRPDAPTSQKVIAWNGHGQYDKCSLALFVRTAE
jgi:hypothetical protein